MKEQITNDKRTMFVLIGNMKCEMNEWDCLCLSGLNDGEQLRIAVAGYGDWAV